MNFSGRLRDPDSATFDEPRGGRRLRWILIALAVLIVLAIVISSVGRHKAAPADKGDGKGQSTPTVSVMVPGRRAIAGSVTATGSLAARREMPVGVAGEGGMVSRVLVDAGDWVRAGQTLATIDQSVQAQQAAQLSAQIKAAQADADLAQSNLDRSLKLVARGFISKADIDQKTATRDAARAQVQVARAQLGQTRAQIGRLDIRAPASGLVLTRGVEPGQVVSSGSGALFRIAKDGEMELMARIAENDLAHLKVGLPAAVTPIGGTRVITGTIWQLAPVIDQQSRQGTARVALHYDPVLRPGGFASVTIQSGTVDAPLLPESAVLSDDKGNYVYVVDAHNKVARRDIEVGPLSGSGIAVLSGLVGNERVIASAGPFLNPGDMIKPQRVATPQG